MKKAQSGSECGHSSLHLVFGESETVGFVKPFHHEGSIAASSAQASSHRDVLAQLDAKFGKLEFFAQRIVDAHDKVGFRASANLKSAGGKFCWPSFALGGELKRITEGDGIEKGFEIMVAVGTSAHDVQTDVYLAVGKLKHD